MDSFGNAGKYITAGIMGLIAAAIAFVIFTPLQNSTDNYFLSFVEHCDNGSDRFVRAYAADTSDPDDLEAIKGLPAAVSNSSGNCVSAAITEPASYTGEVRSEHGVRIGTAASGTVTLIAGSSKWITPKPYMLTYGGISRLILSVLPVLVISMFLGLTAVNLVNYAGAGGGLVQTATRSLAGLLTTMAMLVIAPILLGFLDGVYDITAPGRLSVMNMFGGIVRLVLGFVPVVFTAGLLALFAIQGFLRISGTGGDRSYV